MSSKKFSLFSGIIILLYVGAVLFFLGGLITTSSKGAVKSQEYFENLAASVEQLHETEQLLSSGYVAALKDLTDTTPHVEAILLKKDSVPFLAYPTDSGFIKQDETHTPVLTSSSPVIKMYSKTVSLGSSGTISITAAVSTITKETIFNLAIKSFVIVLVTTLVVIGNIIITRTKKDTDDENADENQQDEKHAEPVANDNDDIVSNINAAPAAEETEPAALKETSETAEPELTETNEPVIEQIVEPVVPASIDPAGLFSPTTGFCWESYLEPRLETELTRAGSCEEDLAVFYIRLAGADFHNAALKPLYDQLLQFFQYRDLIFERGTDGFMCIVPDIGIDGAMGASEKLYSMLYEGLNTAGIHARIAIGISTRTMRLAPASRLINEASEAVAHALEEDDMPIVAFRVNQEKYREYLQEETKKIQVSEAESESV